MKGNNQPFQRPKLFANGYYMEIYYLTTNNLT